MLTEAELLALMADLESFRVERTISTTDTAIGAHVSAVEECRKDFRRLARRLAQATGLALPAPTESW